MTPILERMFGTQKCNTYYLHFSISSTRWSEQRLSEEWSSCFPHSSHCDSYHNAGNSASRNVLQSQTAHQATTPRPSATLQPSKVLHESQMNHLSFAFETECYFVHSMNSFYCDMTNVSLKKKNWKIFIALIDTFRWSFLK